MQNGFQTSGISYWKHGEMVAERYIDLFWHVQQLEWRLPDWFIENKMWIEKQLAPYFDKIQTYQVWHDCGKAFCKMIDENNKIHYPNHAHISQEIWLQCGGDHSIGELIRDDMICHTLKLDDAIEFSKNPNALILLVTALCEIHANAQMFGGLGSESFIIKWKRLNKCGNIIIQELLK